jgi:hypothetical protein
MSILLLMMLKQMQPSHQMKPTFRPELRLPAFKRLLPPPAPKTLPDIINLQAYVYLQLKLQLNNCSRLENKQNCQRNRPSELKINICISITSILINDTRQQWTVKGT